MFTHVLVVLLKCNDNKGTERLGRIKPQANVSIKDHIVIKVLNIQKERLPECTVLKGVQVTKRVFASKTQIKGVQVDNLV